MDDLKKAVNAPERLIDANELMEWLRSKIQECVFLNAHAEAATTEEIIRYVKHMPAVDAVPVVHGRWNVILNPFWDAECSECGYAKKTGWEWGFCPNCGATMDGSDNK